MRSTVERTLTHLRRREVLAAKAEQWVPSHHAQRQAQLGRVLEAYLGEMHPDELEAKLKAKGHHRRRLRQSPGVRKDLFGFVDVLAIDADGVLMIQSVAAAGDLERHLRDYRSDPSARYAIREALLAGVRVEMWAWKKARMVKKDGTLGAAMRWQVERRRLELDEAEYFVAREVGCD